MTEISINGIDVGNAVVDINVRSNDEDIAEKMVTDLRDRAFRVSQAMGTGVNPDDAEPHPVTVAWDRVLNDRFEEGSA